jgi:hypothetical protein
LRYFYNLYASGWLQNNFAPNVYHFKWPYFEWLPDISTPHIYILWGATILGIIFFVLGLLYRGNCELYHYPQHHNLLSSFKHLLMKVPQ